MEINLEKIKEVRISKGYTQDYMALRLGWKNRSTYAKRELGLVDLGVNEFIKMAKNIGI